MSRIGELVLGVISAVFSVIAIILLSVSVVQGSTVFQEEGFNDLFEQEIMSDPNLSSQDAEAITQGLDVFLDLFTILGWGFIISIVISLVLNILGILFINKNKKPKLAGVMFILAGLLAGIISLTSILLYIAAIMCFVRKPPMQLAEQEYYTSTKME
ncbi:DUF4064 domain-containing protein [Bacillus sp. FJAT-22090]|uniref:DUF4064 domain-containing protein n=1 Tax=Bacillus sp. FJAT-22090 TaxID=1581038 RepID=UPI0011A71437|nr:DUF4064 domain-containing protein [Bacillus sp. FJAT-22090]